MAKTQRGRPRKYTEATHFGMRLAPKERKQIELLVRITGAPSTKDALMLAVRDKVLSASHIPLATNEELEMDIYALKKLPKPERARIIRAQVAGIEEAYRKEILEDIVDLSDD